MTCRGKAYNFIQRHFSLEEKREKWLAILSAKYSRGSRLAQLLMSTGDSLLVEQQRFNNEHSEYSGAVENGRLVGRNFMGFLLMEIRDLLLACHCQ